MDNDQITLIGDADRDRVISQLHGFFASGHLTEQELDNRVSDALKSRTKSQLSKVLGQLPMPVAPVKRKINWSKTLKYTGYYAGWVLIPVGIAQAVCGPLFICLSDKHGIPAMNAVYIALSIIFGCAAFVAGCVLVND